MTEEMTTIWLDTVDSTQNEVRRHVEEYDNMTVVAALFQTAGKGQRGNRWSSGRGENLTFSLLLRPNTDGIKIIPAKEQFYISMVSSLAVKELLNDYGINSKIKWPNDIYVGDRKICGMLIENTVNPKGMVEFSIIGIGLNVNQIVFPPELMNPTSMSKITHKRYEIKSVLNDLMQKFLRLTKLPTSSVRQLYLDNLFRLGILSEFSDTRTGETFRGTIRGINQSALLVVEKQDGTLENYAFKEIGYVL